MHSQAGVVRIRPLEPDPFPRPSLAELENAERAARELGDMDRAEMYRRWRMRRLRMAQLGLLG